MLSPSQIALHLQECLPLLTDRFHDLIPVTSGSVSSGILTLTFPSAHGLTAGRKVMINSALIRNKITSAALTVDNTVRFETESQHDLTAFMEERPGRQWPDGQSVTLELPSGKVTYNLDPTAAGVPSPTLFEAIEGTPVPPITGSEYLLENRSIGLLGAKEITSTPTTTTITIDLSDVPSIPDGPIIIENIITKVRVAIAVDSKRAEKIYTKKGNGKDYLFVIMEDRDVSQNRGNNDDFKSLPGSSLRLLNVIQNFSTLILMPTANDLGAGSVTEFAYVDLFDILIACLYGWEGSGYTGDGQVEYNTSYYGHAYDWQSRHQIDYTDGFRDKQTVAFRELDTTQTIFDEGDSDANIDL